MSEKKLVSPYALYKSDVSKENEGTWIPVGPYQFKLARAGAGNAAFKKMASQKFKPYAVAIQNDTLPEAIAQDLTVELFVETIVKDWKDIPAEDGSPLAFSKEAATKLFVDLPELFTEVREASLKLSNFRTEAIEAIAGN